MAIAQSPRDFAATVVRITAVPMSLEVFCCVEIAGPQLQRPTMAELTSPGGPIRPRYMTTTRSLTVIPPGYRFAWDPNEVATVVLSKSS